MNVGYSEQIRKSVRESTKTGSTIVHTVPTGKTLAITNVLISGRDSNPRWLILSVYAPGIEGMLFDLTSVYVDGGGVVSQSFDVPIMVSEDCTVRITAIGGTVESSNCTLVGFER